MMSDTADSMILCLMRHAKSDWDHVGLGDHDRPLNKRGQRDAPRMAKWMSQRGYLPEVILASTAARVRETVQSLLSVWSHQPLVLFSGSLYLSTPTVICEQIVSEAITADGNRPKTILVVAHNPGIERLVGEWLGTPIHMSTAEVAVFRCEPLGVDDIFRPRIRRVMEMMKPKQLDEKNSSAGKENNNH